MARWVNYAPGLRQRRWLVKNSLRVLRCSSNLDVLLFDALPLGAGHHSITWLGLGG